jgi:lipopolysaccharide export system protein LptC
MATSDNPYSQFVALAKVLLPLAALGLLSTLFLFGRIGPQTSDIPFAEIEDIARDPRLSGAAYTGVATDGSVVSVGADTLRPEAGMTAFAVEGLTARIDRPDGTRIEVNAPIATFDNETRIARVTGLAQIETSDGYRMESAGVEADLSTGTVRSLGPLEARAPFGTLTAGRMVAETRPDGGGATMVFSDGVSLVYIPNP